MTHDPLAYFTEKMRGCRSEDTARRLVVISLADHLGDTDAELGARARMLLAAMEAAKRYAAADAQAGQEWFNSHPDA